MLIQLNPDSYPTESTQFSLRGMTRFSTKADFYRPLLRIESLPRNGTSALTWSALSNIVDVEEDGENTRILITLIPRAAAAEGSGRSTSRRNYNETNIEATGKT